jgi:hypothetical protein
LEWEREIAAIEARRLLLVALRGARGQVSLSQLSEALEPSVRRLTLAQRRQVARALRDSLAAARLSSGSGEPSGSAASRRR